MQFLEAVNERIDGGKRGGIYDETAIDATRAVERRSGDRHRGTASEGVERSAH
ncbi:hypothetical protein [Halostagnicola sp. A-GB9-2]|uniref:hypothetical protein n=1 Tax=Halostagnicola sp. A-GB9-2 TaxID=3048066 RepID=UPI0024C073E9|nr:hypothetical protein [Halostagnicola sp. A-GB9-2]MDJ1432619.1 hypothetical protein [Halostagnicola sp. A-GB9-2]